jgi:hypothetical protein
MKIAGIKPFTRDDDNFINELKQAALLFDKIGIPLLDPFLYTTPHPDMIIKAELRLLKDKNFLFDAWQSGPIKLAKGVDLKEIQNELDLMTKLRLDKADSDMMFEASARQSAVILNNQHDKPDFFSVPLLKKLNSSSEQKATRGDVIQIIIEKIPIPDEKTPWENIWNFKQDSDNIGKMSGIRMWINGVVNSSFTISEIKDELDFKLYQYRKSLETHKIKYKSGILQSFIVGSAELLENVAKLKFSSIARGFFSANQEKIDLLNVELNAPGHELAYIYQVQESFN